MGGQRLDPDRLLNNIRLQQAEAQMGKLKIFFGYAAGVGKTYAMLEAAHEAQRAGRDVVVGYVERHTRPDTLALLDRLEVMPCKEVDYKGAVSYTHLDVYKRQFQARSSWVFSDWKAEEL